jgi:hypothetical protein
VGIEPARGGHPFLARRFQDEAGFRRRVKVAREQNIPPSQLDGREPAEVTEYEYDNGLLVRSVTTREPIYTEQDRAELIAYEIYLEGLCPLCGRPVEVCTSPEDGGPQFVPTYRTCRASMELADLRAGLAKKHKSSEDGDRYAPARLWSTQIRER